MTSINEVQEVEIEEMNKTMEIELTELMTLSKKELSDVVLEMECQLIRLEDRLSQFKKLKKGRKLQVLELMQQGEALKISEIATIIGIKNRNVSCLLSYLRDDGHEFEKSGRGSGMIKLKM